MGKYAYVGAAWKKNGKNGTFLSFSIDTNKLAECAKDDKGRVSATLFKNDNKENPSQPDYNLVVNTEFEAGSGGSKKKTEEVEDLPF
jgi:uncharacterized protein (DUF736 family)